MGATLADVPAELVLDFLRGAIASGRARSPKLTTGALTLAVERASGLSDYFTVYITPEDVTLQPGAAPLSWKGPLVTLFAREDALSALVQGGKLDRAEVMGDTQLLSSIALCLSGGFDPISVRVR